MRRLYLVRHGKAGDRSRYDGDDSERPLTKNGRTQADWLPDHLPLVGAAPRRILSSPAVRCVETVTPLAARVGARVETCAWLAEGASALVAVTQLAALEAEVAAACSHGDVIWGILEWLGRGGVALPQHLDAQKASTWILDWPDSSGEGVPIRATYLPPPAGVEAPMVLPPGDEPPAIA